jgi:hypothetical protein
MRHNGIPITRESYLAVNYGDRNFPLDAEGEADLPPELRPREE